MGNRAVITTKKNFENDGIGIYLHWNGGRDSVEAFLKYCEIKGYRTPDRDNYGWARLCQVIGNFFGGSTSIGIDKVSNLDCDNWDNGTYIIEGWNIVDRKYFEGSEQYCYDLNEMLKSIDEAQPEKEQLGSYLTATEIETEKLSIGDEVYILDYDGKPEKFVVVGFGADEFRNGHNVKDVPYVNQYSGMGDYCNNVNNYIFEKKVKITGYKQVEKDSAETKNENKELKLYRYCGRPFGDTDAGIVKAYSVEEAIQCLRKTFEDYDLWEDNSVEEVEFNDNNVCEVYYGG